MTPLVPALFLALSAAPALAEDEVSDEAGDEVGGAVPDAVNAPPPAEAPEAEAPEDGFSMGALPALNYNTDEGFGYGVIGTLYWYRGGVEPYRSALTVRFFMTTKNVHAHLLRLDSLDVKGLPLRIDARLGYNSYLTANYCGIASESFCDPLLAELEADEQGLAEGSEEREDFLRRYYFYRYTEPFTNVNGRWKLSDKPHRIEVFGGFRFSWYRPGRPGDWTPWPDSYYSTFVDPDGDTSLASVLQAGLMADNRDNEPAPNSGYWVEGSLRGATSLAGDSWSYAGSNVTLRYYQTLIPTAERASDGAKVRRPNLLVSASRLVGDGIFGGQGMPVPELVRFGGATGFDAGGQYGGRGMRAWRYHGRAKALAQQELRLTPLTLTPGSQQFDLGVLGFADYGMAADDWDDLSEGNAGLGYGGGLRVTWNRNFIVRVDVAYSEEEDYAQKMYINLDHIF